MIIIEGPDLVGKTTAAHALVELLPGEMHYSHMSKPGDDFDHVNDYVNAICRNSVQDRFHIGEAVYPYVRGEEPRMDLRAARLVESYLAIHRAYTVVITLEDCQFDRRYRDDEMYSLKQIICANKMFERIANGQDHHGYNFHVDRWFRLDKYTPYLTDGCLSLIVEDYLRLQDESISVGLKTNEKVCEFCNLRKRSG